MDKKDRIILNLKLDIDKKKEAERPKFVFIGGLPGSGKSLTVEKVKQDFVNNDFVEIEADLYRDYFNDKRYVEETIEEANYIEEQLLNYAIDNHKDIISISTLRSYEYINELIENKLIKLGYDIYFYIIITNHIESSLCTYERYINDKKQNKKFPRLNKFDYLNLINSHFVESIEWFSNKDYFKQVKFLVRGKNLSLPVEIVNINLSVSEFIENEIKFQINNLCLNELNERIDNILNNLTESYEKKEFEEVVHKLIKSNIE